MDTYGPNIVGRLVAGARAQGTAGPIPWMFRRWVGCAFTSLGSTIATRWPRNKRCTPSDSEALPANAWAMLVRRASVGSAQDARPLLHLLRLPKKVPHLLRIRRRLRRWLHLDQLHPAGNRLCSTNRAFGDWSISGTQITNGNLAIIPTSSHRGDCAGSTLQ
jgi:hypothetical protein